MNIQIGEIRRLSACGLRTLKIPVKGEDNKFVIVYGTETRMYPDGQSEQLYLIRDMASGKVYDADKKISLHTKDTVHGFSESCFTSKIYGKVEIEGTTRSIGAVSSEAVELRRQHLEKRGKLQ